jgi:hypothetical protein
MIKQSFIVFKYEAGALMPHDHPVFAGEVAYDLPGAQQEIPIDSEFDIREFTSVNEVSQAINDYMRQAPEPIAPAAWYILQKNANNNYSQGFKTR